MNTKKIFSIRSKIIIVVAISIFLLSIIIYFISTFFLLKNYRNIEKVQMMQDIQRVSDAIGSSVTQLNVKLADWTWWDDTYKFINDKNEAYIESNLGINSIANLKINAMVFVNTNGSIVFKKMIDFRTKQEVPADNIGAHVSTHKMLLSSNSESSTQGILILPEGPMMFATLPILTSDGEGPMRGTLMFGKFLDNEMITDLEKLTHLSIKMYSYESSTFTSDVAIAKVEILKNKEFFIAPLSSKSIAGYSVLNDIYGAPALIFKIEIPRDVYNQGLSTLYYFMTIAIFTIFLFGIIIIIFIEKFFVSRFSVLSRQVMHIGENRDFKERLIEGKKDEIGEFAGVVNQMLEALSVSLDAQNKLVIQASANQQKLNERLEELEHVNKVMVDRELKMIELKEEIKKLKLKK